MIANAFNIFKRGLKRTIEGKHLREELTNKILEDIPRDFINFFDEELIINPVMTKSGHIFEQKSIEKWLKDNPTSPLTREPLSKEELVSAPRLKDILNEFKSDQEEMLEKISTIQSLREETMIRNTMEQFSKRVKNYVKQFEIAKNELLEQIIIRSTKNKLFLDINIPEHLDFWNEQKRCLDVGLVKVQHKKQRFRLSHPVHNVLMAANREYKRVSEFQNAIKQAQTEDVGCWANFWGETEKSKKIRRLDLLQCNFKKDEVAELKR